MNDLSLLWELEDIARRTSLEVHYMNMKDDELSIKSGSCKVKGKNWVVIDKRLTLNEKKMVLASELAKLDLEDIYIRPVVRELIDRERPI